MNIDEEYEDTALIPENYITKKIKMPISILFLYFSPKISFKVIFDCFYISAALLIAINALSLESALNTLVITFSALSSLPYCI